MRLILFAQLLGVVVGAICIGTSETFHEAMAWLVLTAYAAGGVCRVVLDADAALARLEGE